MVFPKQYLKQAQNLIQCREDSGEQINNCTNKSENKCNTIKPVFHILIIIYILLYMLDFALKNMKRRKTRTILTTLGIIIGIAAIVALGSFSEGMSLMVTEELGAMTGKVMVFQKGSGGVMSAFSGSDVTDEQLEIINDMPGVKETVPMVWHMPPFGPGHEISTWAIIGMEIDKIDYFIGETIEMSEGRRPDPDESDVAIAGITVAESMRLAVGDLFDFKDKSFEIVGVAEETGINDVDMSLIVPLTDLQDALDIDTYQMVYVVLEDPETAEDFADEVEDNDDTLEAMTSTDMIRMVSEIMDQIRIFTFGIGAIAAFVGGLGVLNTMIMAVMERRREIGVMKAIGATRRFILFQILTESSLLSLTGGMIGLFLGWVASFGFGVMTGGLLTAAVTPALAIGSLAFAFALGFAGGLYPAWKAAKLDPVDALRG